MYFSQKLTFVVLEHLALCPVVPCLALPRLALPCLALRLVVLLSLA